MPWCPFKSCFVLMLSIQLTLKCVLKYFWHLPCTTFYFVCHLVALQSLPAFRTSKQCPSFWNWNLLSLSPHPPLFSVFPPLSVVWRESCRSRSRLLWLDAYQSVCDCSALRARSSLAPPLIVAHRFVFVPSKGHAARYVPQITDTHQCRCCPNTRPGAGGVHK